MTLHVLPTRTAGAAENMAVDFLLLQRYPPPPAPRFRHYEWRAPAFTFGYSQKISFVRQELAARVGAGADRIDICRRPTGGGIVDHRDDWTYALVIPRGHALEELRATQSYRVVHEALADALSEQGVPAKAMLERMSPESGASEQSALSLGGQPGVCFERAEIYDVIDTLSGAKIAGAAQKRNKHGLLFQGSIWRPTTGGNAIDWEKFEQDFVTRLGVALDAADEMVPWPEFNEDELGGLVEQYSSPEWIEGR